MRGDCNATGLRDPSQLHVFQHSAAAAQWSGRFGEGGTAIAAISEHLSASSRMTTLCRPGGRVTFFWANILILFRTTSMPLRRAFRH